jgi:hypothetical protein
VPCEVRVALRALIVLQFHCRRRITSERESVTIFHYLTNPARGVKDFPIELSWARTFTQAPWNLGRTPEFVPSVIRVVLHHRYHPSLLHPEVESGRGYPVKVVLTIHQVRLLHNELPGSLVVKDQAIILQK